MERRQLEFFLAIAEAGSFTRASQVLHIAQPSLSHSMRTLEAELGSPLFERHGRGVRLTAAGEALVGPARRAVRSFGLAASAVRGVVEGDVGVLRIVSSTSWAVHPLVGPRVTVAGDVPVSNDGRPSRVVRGNAEAYSRLDELIS